MNRQELDALVGLPLAEAEALVRKAGLIPRSSRLPPSNVVMLHYGLNNIVFVAESEASIEAKHATIHHAKDFAIKPRQQSPSVHSPDLK
jgi:hypothetical protein